MRRFKNIICFFALGIGITGLSHQVSGQNKVLPSGAGIGESETDSFIQKLPVLEVLIDSALSHAPELKLHNLDVNMKDLEVSNAKKSWSKNIISGSASYNYGDNLLINESLGLGQLSSGTGPTSHYSLGVSMKIPLMALFDHQDIKKANIERERVEAQKSLIIQNIRENVNARYQNLINAYQKYKILLSDYESYEINLQNAEHDFLSSRISVQDLTSFKTAYSKAKLDLIQAKNEFNNALWLLEELVRFRLKF